MSYKIAIASSDGVVIDRSFGETEKFWIAEVDDNGTYRVAEVRQPVNENGSKSRIEAVPARSQGCGSRTGCGSGASPKSLLVQDCRCLMCTKIGFQVYKELEKKAISVFEIDCKIEDALKKVIQYYGKVDRHQSLRKTAKEQSS